MFRLKNQQPTPTLPVRRLWTVGASASVALSSYILVGYCISEVAGPATLVSVAVSSVLAAITGLAYVELTQRTQATGSPYSFCYTYLGELPAFVVGWAVVGECVVGAGLMAKAITYYSSFLSNDTLLTSLQTCCALGDHQTELWSFFDPVAMSAVIIVGVACALNSHLACRANQILLLLNFITVIFTIIVIGVKGSRDSWQDGSGHSTFVPSEFGAHGVFRASAIYMHVFLTLVTTATLATQSRGATSSTAISLVVTLIVAIIAMIKAVSVSLLQPYDMLNSITPVATSMKAEGLGWVATLNCLGALVASVAGILSMLVLSANTLEQMASDGLLWSRLAARRPSIAPTVTTLISTALAGIGAAFQDFSGLVLCLSSGTFLVFQALLIAVMVSRSHASRESALMIVLKFTWLLYFFVSPALVIMTNRLSEKRQVQSALQGILSGVVLMFLQLAINRHQLDVRVVAVQVGTSVVMGFSSYLMYQLHQWAWYRLFIWTFLGMLVYTLYGYRKSHLGRGIVDLAVVPHDECVRSLEGGLDNAGFQHELAELGVGRGRRSQRSFGGHSYGSARSRQKASFHSAREDGDGRDSFRSVRESDERGQSFGSVSSAQGSGDRPDGGRRRYRQESFLSLEEEGSQQLSEADQSRGSSRVSFGSVRAEDRRGSFGSVRDDDRQGSFKSLQDETSQEGRNIVKDEEETLQSGDVEAWEMRPGDTGVPSVEILINPRRLCEEMYLSRAPQAPVSSEESVEMRQAASELGRSAGHAAQPVQSGPESTPAELRYTGRPGSLSSSDGDDDRRAQSSDDDADSEGSRRRSSGGSASASSASGQMAVKVGSGVGVTPAELEPESSAQLSLSLSDVWYDDDDELASQPAPTTRHQLIEDMSEQISAHTGDDSDDTASGSSRGSIRGSGVFAEAVRPCTKRRAGPRARRRHSLSSARRPPRMAGVLRRRLAERHARETMVHDDAEQRAVSFVATPPGVELSGLDSSGLCVRPELDRLASRLATRDDRRSPAANDGRGDGGRQREVPDGEATPGDGLQRRGSAKDDVVFC
ncbi:uncharacterized protein LOC119098324 [Pollicipes pollicipes]|uniref:uncharacterized protein LOC119098324 n=1 Tax=Pollicipes pollicipes TaxID=41117 RepID=UPI0018852816|nr:uncharacterized protein LOC119098324 [Pollicipes pollicipes]